MTVQNRSFLRAVCGLVLALTACNAAPVARTTPTPSPSATPSRSPAEVNIYAAALTTKLSAAVADITPRVYVPNAVSNTVDVIDPTTYKIINHVRVGTEPQHITPSWDLTTLYVGELYNGDGALRPIDPVTGAIGDDFPIRDPYNLYYTPDGTKAIVVAERFNSLDFRDPHTWKLLGSVPIPSPGVDHLDFTADGRYLVASTEYAGVVVRVDTVTMKLAGTANVGGLPVDVKLAPDGSVMFVANQARRSGISVIDPATMKVLRFIPTARGAHGFALSRDGHYFYLSNRDAGKVSLFDWRAQRIVKVWTVGGSPDMLQVTPDGAQVWYSNRYHGYVSVMDARTGKILHTIRTGTQPHGLCYFPQPGRISLGHNGVYR